MPAVTKRVDDEHRKALGWFREGILTLWPSMVDPDQIPNHMLQSLAIGVRNHSIKSRDIDRRTVVRYKRRLYRVFGQTEDGLLILRPKKKGRQVISINCNPVNVTVVE